MGDQKRVVTPSRAKKIGSTYIVVGRPITQSETPYESYLEIKKNGTGKIMREIAEKLLEIKAVALSPNEPFTWASGMKSPIYCDNRLTMSFPEVRRAIAKV